MTKHEIGNCTVNYFDQLFQSGNPTDEVITEIIRG